MVEIRHLRKTFGETVAVNDLSLQIPKGICFGLLGPNGAGKSTAISIICGIDGADEGQVVFDGSPLDPNDQNQKRRFGYVPQELSLYEELTALENLRLFGSLYSLDRDYLAERVRVVLEITGLEGKASGAVKSFSGGMKRRLNFALAILHDPEFLVLDEPTVGVDPQSRNLIFEALDLLISEGKTLLYTSHYMEEIERLCTRIAIMDHGSIIAEGSLETLLAMLPASRKISVQLAQPPDPKSLAVLREQIDSSSGSTNISVHTGAEGPQLIDVLTRVDQAVGPIVGISTERPSLEQLFLNLTGRALRD